MKLNEYKCASCGEINEKGRNDKEAEEEYKKLWPDSYQKNRDVAIICDDCFKKGMKRFV